MLEMWKAAKCEKGNKNDESVWNLGNVKYTYFKNNLRRCRKNDENEIEALKNLEIIKNIKIIENIKEQNRQTSQKFWKSHMYFNNIDNCRKNDENV